MAYEGTTVTVGQSQQAVRKLIMAHGGTKIAFISEPPREGFQAVVAIDGTPYMVRVAGSCKPYPRNRVGQTARMKEQFQEQEERRIWRVLYYHLKAVFEAADSGVMEFRELMLPYIVTKSGQTVAETIIPRLAQAVEQNPALMLP